MARNKFDIDETLETPFSFAHLKRAGKYIKSHAGKMLLALGLSFMSVIIWLFGPKLLQEAIDVAIPNGDKGYLLWLSFLYLMTIVLSVAFNTIRSRIMARVGQEIIYEIRRDLFEHLQRLSFQYFDDRPAGKVLVRVIHYVNNVSDTLSNGIINFVLEAFNVIFIMVFMLTTNVKLTLIVLAGLPVFVVFVFLIKPRQRRAWQQVSNKSSNLTAYLSESIDGARITQVFTREEENMGIYERLNTNYRNEWMKAQYTSNTVWVTVENISTAVTALLYVVGVKFLAPGVSFGTILAMGNYATRFWNPILQLSNLYNNFINSIAYLERIFETMDEEVTVDNLPGAYEMPEIMGNVDFEDVTFSYDGNLNILEDFNLSVKAGESIALVGPTGAGKTTVVNLIPRFYDIKEGTVKIDGHSVSDVTIRSLRSQMGIMLQDSFIFSGTIEENIRYGRLDATRKEIIEACRTVYADEFIRELENGYDTVVTERGGSLSQGQKQLIAFARTLLSDPKILILDEATSSIDAKTEQQLQKGLLELLKGRTSFIIAHRLSTISSCDRILYVADKGISESGTHEELLEKRGDYFMLYTAQQDN